MRWKPDWFLLGMGLAILLAWRFPEPGASGGSLQPELLTNLGIALIFFLHGALLSFAALREGVLLWRAHMVVQLATFVLFPLLGFGMLAVAGTALSPALQLGIFYLCALPSTVSSSVAMTAAANGHVPVAVFNATLSSLLGIFLTPLWMSLLLHQAGEGLPLGEVILDLVTWLLLPLLVGQATRPLIGAWLARRKPYVSKIDRVIILLLVYTSFCESFAAEVWSRHGVGTVLLSGALAAVLFGVVLLGLIQLCGWLRMPPDVRSAVVFCGTKKSLAQGVPMARLMFGANPELSLILLPIMLYHSLQLFACAPIARYWSRRA